jgi:hypothetical protein
MAVANFLHRIHGKSSGVTNRIIIELAPGAIK